MFKNFNTAEVVILFKIEYGKIFITRGDTASFNIEVRQPDKRTVYELAEGDNLTFTVKQTDSEVDFLIQKVGATVKLASDDTKKLAYGQYWYDVQLTFADGTINTIIAPTPFVVCSEITFGNEVLDENGQLVTEVRCDRKHGVHAFGTGDRQLVGYLNVNTYSKYTPPAELKNGATSEDIVAGREAYNDQGEVIVGTLDVNDLNYDFGDGLVLDGKTLSVNRDVVDKTYTHTQSVAASTWTIQHNLNKYPAVTVIDSAGSCVVGEVKYIDANALTVIFSGAFSGKAFLN